MALLAATLAGCNAASGPASSSSTSAWAAAVSREQRAELFRPVEMRRISIIGTMGRKPDFTVKVTTGRPGDLVLAADRDGRSELPAELRVTVTDCRDRDDLVKAEWTVTDFYGRRVAGGTLDEMAVPASGSAERIVTLADLKDPGCYEVLVKLTASGSTRTSRHAFAILRAKTSAERPNWLVCPADPALIPVARRLGCTMVYLPDLIAAGAGLTNLAERSPERPWTPKFDPAPLQASTDSFRAAGFSVIGQIGSPMDALKSAADDGLPTDAKEFAACVAPLTAMLPEVRHWDLMPQPLGRHSASAATLHHYLTTLRAEMSRQRPTDATFWVTGDLPAINDLLTAPGMTGLVDAVRFTDARVADPRELGTTLADTARRAGAKRWMVVLSPGQAGDPVRVKAWHAITKVARVLASGGDVELRAEWLQDAPQTAALAHFIESVGNAKPRGEVWPDLPTIRSPVFDGDRRRVAVVWHDGPSSLLVEIPDAASLEATDVLGRPVGLWRQNSLVVPVGEGPIYLTSSRLGLGDFLRRLQQARTVLQTAMADAEALPEPVAIEATSGGFVVPQAQIACQAVAPDFDLQTITGPIGPGTTIPVVLTALGPGTTEADVGLTGPKGWTGEPSLRHVRLEPGQSLRVEFPFRDAAANPDGIYPVEVSMNGIHHKRHIATRQAVAPRLTPTIDGQLGEWGDVPAMAVEPWWLLRPAATTTTGAGVTPNAPSTGTVARVRAAFDEQFFYLSADVPTRLPLRRERTVDPVAAGQVGNPWGPESIQVALGTTGAARPEYVLVLVPTATRPAVVRMAAPGMERRTPRADLSIQGWGEVPESRCAIVSAGDRALYEAAIPRAALAALPWQEGARWRFGFLIEGPTYDARTPGYEELDWQAEEWPHRGPSRVGTFFPLGYRRGAAANELGLIRTAVAK
jgi:hypothetical protein